MKNVTRGVCLFLFVVVALLLASGCKSHRVVEQTNVVDRVGQRVFVADTLASKAWVDLRDSLSLSVVCLDSIVEQVFDSVREVFTVDTAGRVIGHDVWHNTNRQRDHYHFADASKMISSRSVSKDSVTNNGKIFISRDSTYLRDSAKITGITVNESKPNAIRQAVTKVGSGINTIFCVIGVIVFLLVVVAVLLYKKFGIKIWKW